MANLVIRDKNGAEITYEGVEKVKFNTADGGTQLYSEGEAMENIPIALNFSEGDQTVEAPAGYLVKSAVIAKPENLTPENIREGETVAGVTGTLSEYEILENVPIALNFSNGDQSVTVPDGSAVKSAIIQQPETLTPENIAEGVDIAGVIGTLANSEDLDKFIERSITEITTNATSIAEQAFFSNTTIEKVTALNATKIGKQAFASCSALKEVNISCVQSVGAAAFSGCKNLSILDFGTSLNSQIGLSAFNTSGPVGVIIRNTTMIPDAPNASSGYIFGMTTQRLYVPRTMVDTWKNSNYMKQYHSNLVVAIEDYPEICG